MSRDKARLRDDWDNDEYAPSESYVPIMRPKRPERTQPEPRRRKRRSGWPLLLVGCAGGIVILVLAAAIVVFTAFRTATNGGGITGFISPANYTRQSQQTLSLPLVTQILVHNQIGNVTIKVDPNATATVITSVKKVKAASSDDANNQFKTIAVQVEPPGTPATTLSVSATVPDSSGIFSTQPHNDSVDLTITIPQQSVSPSVATSSGTITPAATGVSGATATPLALNLDTLIGSVTVNGLHGVLDIKDDFGSITVNQAVLSEGSHLQTATGSVTFSGGVDTTLNSANATTGCTTNATTAYTLQSEIGDVNVTLTGDPNIFLEAYTNSGTISSDFPINVTFPNGYPDYCGPLLSGSTLNSATAMLALHVSTGNVHIHRA